MFLINCVFWALLSPGGEEERDHVILVTKFLQRLTILFIPSGFKPIIVRGKVMSKAYSQENDYYTAENIYTSISKHHNDKYQFEGIKYTVYLGIDR